MKRALIVGLLIAQAAILPKGVRAQTPTLPSDFAVRFEFGLCTTDVLDTFKNVFVRDMGSRDPAVAVSVVLQTDWLKAIYGAIVEARFFEYPSEFRISGIISGNIGFAREFQHRNGASPGTITREPIATIYGCQFASGTPRIAAHSFTAVSSDDARVIHSSWDTKTRP